MDDVTTRDHIQKHADAVVHGHMDTVAADCSHELRPQLPELAKARPQSVTSAEVLSLDVGDPTSVAVIRYSGDRSALTIRSEWQDLGGDRPVMVNAAQSN